MSERVVEPRRAIAFPHDPLAGLKGRIEPVRISLPYRLAMVAVATAMVILPLLYLALIAAVAYGTWYHAVHNAGPIFRGSGQMRGRLAFYLIPLIAGAAVLLFLIKPLLAPAPRRTEGLRLDPERHSLFFAFVEGLGRKKTTVAPGTPPPEPEPAHGGGH